MEACCQEIAEIEIARQNHPKFVLRLLENLVVRHLQCVFLIYLICFPPACKIRTGKIIGTH